MLCPSFLTEEEVGRIKTIGIIPARAGSKGVPGKNIRLLGGKPLVSYTIESALNSNIDRVVVSTDDEKIAKVALEYGADVPFLRPKELAADETPSISVLLHALRYLVEKGSYRPDAVAFLQPTSPFRTHEHINAGLEILSDSEVDSVVGVCEIDADSHPYFIYVMDKDGDLKELMQVGRKPLRRQELPRFYRLADGLVLTRRRYFERVNEESTTSCFNPRSVKGLLMDEISSFSIDEELDFLMAELIIQKGLARVRV